MAVGHSQTSSSESRGIQTEYRLTKALVKYKGNLECYVDEKLKWWGDLGSLKAFVFALFGHDGKWSSPGVMQCQRFLKIINYYLVRE